MEIDLLNVFFVENRQEVTLSKGSISCWHNEANEVKRMI